MFWVNKLSYEQGFLTNPSIGIERGLVRNPPFNQKSNTVKKSKIPTQHILIKDISNSPEENCDFATVALTPAWIEKLSICAKRIEALKQESDLAKVVYWEATCNFFVDRKNTMPAIQIIGKCKFWCYAQLSEYDLNRLTISKMETEGCQMIIESHGDLYFKCEDAGSFTSFITPKIKISDLINT
jgi:hypothetical protein